MVAVEAVGVEAAGVQVLLRRAAQRRVSEQTAPAASEKLRRQEPTL